MFIHSATHNNFPRPINRLLIACWYVFLGPIGFFFLFVPASIVGFLRLVHCNWSTHNALSPSGR
ncbi:hypothetical protein [Sorangium sp. So ce1389]|uniref:hypothetical protein n=1 Tax=Sorangium sp. So ce1389 TaxID=3133336 RepID=UPI003F624D4B